MKNICIFLIILSFVLLPVLHTHAAETTENTGFIQGNIWYSKEPLVEGDVVKIYTIVFNSREETLAGTVEFYDKDVILGKKDFTVSSGGLKDISVDWNVSAGDHIIFARILNPEIIKGDGTIEPIFLKYNKTGEDKVFVPKTIVEEEGDTLEDIQDFIKEKTPDVVKEKISAITSSIDEWREGTALVLKDKAEGLKQELSQIYADADEKAQINTDEISNYAKFYFFKLLSFIFNNKFLFYGLAILLAFLILRFIWRRIRTT